MSFDYSKLDKHIERRNNLFKSQRPEEDDYGYSLTNPVMTSNVFDSDKYLGRLRTEDGRPFAWERTMSFNIDLGGIEGVNVDAYDLLLDDEVYRTIYICPYGQRSDYVPKGLVLENVEKVTGDKESAIPDEELAISLEKPEREGNQMPIDEQDEDIKTLKELLEAEVITTDEYQAKSTQIMKCKADLTEKIAIEKDSFHEVEINNKSEIGSNNSAEGATPHAWNNNMEARTEAEIFESTEKLRKKVRALTAVCIVAIIALLAAIGGFLYLHQLYNENIASMNKEIENQYDRINELEQYQDVVLNFYLDWAVLTTDQSPYYHRAGCSKIRGEDFYIHNPESINKQYKKCPDCFSEDGDTYVRNHFIIGLPF